MSKQVEIKVPDIGDFDAVEIIEVLVAEGDTVAEEDGLIVLESDKATMDVPSTHGGKVASLKVGVGDTVAEGDVVAVIEVADDTGDDTPDAGDDATDDDQADAGDAEADAPAGTPEADAGEGASDAGDDTE